MTAGDAAQRRRFKAPLRDGEALIEPPIGDVGDVLPRNLALAETRTGLLGGHSLLKLAEQARAALLADAFDYTRRYRAVEVSPPAAGPLFLAGHQPQLFHPGVWFKNFLLSSLAQRHQGTAINLVVDNDTQRQPTIPVPTGSLAAPRLEAVAYDQSQPEMPFEERRIVDRSLLKSFAARVRQTLKPLAGESGWGQREWVLDRFEPLLLQAAERTRLLGEAFAQARHALEGEWGLHTLEVPLSSFCRHLPFRVLMLHLFAHVERLHAIYNQALAEYRRANQLRSRSHPAPDLEADDGWWEVPLWIWTKDDPSRRRVFVHTTRGGFEMTDRGWVREFIPAEDEGIAALGRLEQRGIKLRPKAFITTIYARLFLSDLFLHGIGGAKYDEVTDRLLTDFFGCEPPAFVTATATLRLPLVREPITPAEVDALVLKHWHLQHHPEVFLTARTVANPPKSLAPLLHDKQRLIDQPRSPGADKLRRARITAVNRELAGFLTVERDSAATAIERGREALRRNRLLGSREFSFLLFPLENLRRQLMDASVI